jgi:hypothetical protein
MKKKCFQSIELASHMKQFLEVFHQTFERLG